MTDRKEITAPIPSVGADGGQLRKTSSASIIPAQAEEINRSGKSFEEMMREMERTVTGKFLPGAGGSFQRAVPAPSGERKTRLRVALLIALLSKVLLRYFRESNKAAITHVVRACGGFAAMLLTQQSFIDT